MRRLWMWLSSRRDEILKFVVGICLMLVPILTITNAYLYSTHQTDAVAIQTLRSEGAQAHAALCSFKMDLQTRYSNGVVFLHDHPDGIAGISAATIKASLDNQLATLEALTPLVCP